MSNKFFTPLIVCSLASFMILLIISQIIVTTIATQSGDRSLVMWANGLKKIDYKDQSNLVKKAWDRVNLYEQQISKLHLSSGMVISRSIIDRKELDLCDSLLFSSIRFVALTKLGFTRESEKAWTAIERSRKNGVWLRHPKCSRKSLSRDMLSGLLLALLQNPPRSKDYLTNLVHQIDQKSGYFSNGPVYLSYLTPGLGKIIRMLSNFHGISSDSFPDIVRQGYSTNELSVILLKPGYEAHLAALALWIELEIDSVLKIREKPGILEKLFNSFVRPFSGGGFTAQSFSWTAKRLFEIDPQNLFFTYLRLRVAGAMNTITASFLLEKLLEMEQFPRHRLPSDCERRADYLWQRASKGYQSRSMRCNVQYPGVDFIWMVSLLIKAMNPDILDEIRQIK